MGRNSQQKKSELRDYLHKRQGRTDNNEAYMVKVLGVDESRGKTRINKGEKNSDIRQSQ